MEWNAECNLNKWWNLIGFNDADDYTMLRVWTSKLWSSYNIVTTTHIKTFWNWNERAWNTSFETKYVTDCVWTVRFNVSIESKKTQLRLWKQQQQHRFRTVFCCYVVNIFMCLASEMNVKEHETKRIFMSTHTHIQKKVVATQQLPRSRKKAKSFSMASSSI